MKKYLFISLFVVVILLSSLVPVVNLFSKDSSVDASQIDDVQKISLDYLQYLKNHQFDEAYSLTTDAFREKIPLSAFEMDIDSSNFINDLISFNPGDAVVNDNKATVKIPISYSNSNKETMNDFYTMNLCNENGIWKVALNWEDYLSAKLETQDPLAIYHHSDVSIALKYLLIYMDRCVTRVRLDINNDSNDTLKWVMPRSNAEDSHIKDVSTGKLFTVQAGNGIRFTNGEKFELTKKEGEFTLTAAPGTKGSIFLYFELLPETVSQLEMILTGFSFESNGELWNASFSNVSSRFDIAPSTQVSQ